MTRSYIFVFLCMESFSLSLSTLFKPVIPIALSSCAAPVSETSQSRKRSRSKTPTDDQRKKRKLGSASPKVVEEEEADEDDDLGDLDVLDEDEQPADSAARSEEFGPTSDDKGERQSVKSSRSPAADDKTGDESDEGFEEMTTADIDALEEDE